MKRITLSLLAVLFFCFLFTGRVSASHYAGCDLTYTCIGGNDYLVTLTFYRDCSGISAPSSVTIQFQSSCGSFSSTFQQVGPGVEVTPTCPGQVTTCGGGSLYGLQRYIYQGQVTMVPCANWTISWTDCCRNPSNTIQNPTSTDWYIPATLNNAAAPCNSSPTFTNMPATIICNGQNFCYNHGALDPDGDSLVYSLVSPFQALSTPVNYMGGYSATNPLPSNPAVNINPVTGDICMTPTANIIAVVGVRVDEWRRVNGVPTKIGSIIRDMQINVITCNNLLPTLAGINPNATQWDPNDTTYAVEICLGDTVAFSIFGHDGNTPPNNINITWNSGIPDGSWSVTGNGTPNAVGHFFWIPSSSEISNVPHCFTATVQDDACPYVGQQTFSYCITIKGINVELHPEEDSLLCMGESYYIYAHGDTNAINFYWYVDGNAATPVNDTTFLISSTSLGPGNHTISVKVDDGSMTICPGYDDVQITVVPQPDVNLGPPQIACSGQTVTLDAGPGAVYVWSPGGQNTQTIGVTSTGIYSVLVDGGQGTRCIDTGSVYIRFLQRPNVNLGPDLCITQPTTLDAGFPGFHYQWNTGDTTQIVNVPYSGLYVVTVSELFGHNCDDRDSVVVVINPVPTLIIGSDTSMCSHHTINLYARDIEGYLDNPNYVYSYYWTLSGAPVSSSRSLSLTCVPAGFHEIKLAVTGCVVTDTTRNLETKFCYLELPNIITPNGDDKNDKFEITGIEYFPNSTMLIYNRWGKKIFESTNYNNDDQCWDARNLADGVYYFVLKVNYGAQNSCMEAKDFSGTITVIR